MNGPLTQQHIVRVAVFVPLWTSFDYLWHDDLGLPEVGIRVLLPFGHSQRVGVVLAIDPSENDTILKTVLDRLDIRPLFESARCRWLDRAASYYLCPKGEMWELALAWAGHDAKRRFKCASVQSLTAWDEVLASAFKTTAALSLATIAKRCATDGIQWRTLQALEQGLLEEVVKPTRLLSTPHDTNAFPQKLTLRLAQASAVQQVEENHGMFFPMLLFGCTGSGKTEVYLQAAAQCVAKGESVLILVPEIGLTPMWQQRLAARFEHVGIWHSGLSLVEKNRVRHGLPHVEILLGTRSALFLPLKNLGLIVIDEEHDTSFKQHDGVPYSARDMSLLLAQELKIPVILGSATPSLESWRQVQQGNMACVRLTERVFQHTSIQPEIIDMRGKHDVLSPALLQALQAVHQRGEQSMLYLNRRGYAPSLHCTACGHVPTCQACSLRLTLHRKAGVLRCHACDYVRRVQRSCDTCGEKAYLPIGSGTERLEDDLALALPDLRIARFDRDVIRHAGDLEDVLSQFERGDIDCLLGTQMLVKGHHFPNVTLVGIINADLGMNLPDFRASERWWQQMTQVFGRTGRGEQAGRVVVQTWNPDAPWFERLDEQKAEEVLNDELSLREITSFPPYGRWVRLVFSAVDHEKAIKAAKAFAEHMQACEGIRMSGPMPCALERLAGRFRFELIFRDESRQHLPWKLLPVLQQLRVPSGVRRKVDVDPQDLM